MDEAEIKALLDTIAVYKRVHDGTVAAFWACADVFGDTFCYRYDSEPLSVFLR